MPNRIVRDGILTSEAMASLSWPAEVCYRRLMSVVDDHGRFHGLPMLIRAACYPLQLDKVSDADIGKWLSECETAALVSVYPAADGKRYVQIEKFGQQVRSKSKFPEPMEGKQQQLKSSASNCDQVQANAHLVEGVSVSVSVSECATRGKPRKKPIPKDFGVSERVRTWAQKHNHAQLNARLTHFVGKAKANGYTYADWDEAFMNAIRDDWARLGSDAPQPQQASLEDALRAQGLMA